MNIITLTLSILCLLITYDHLGKNYVEAIEGYDLPLLPVEFPTLGFNVSSFQSDKYIDRNVWIAMRDSKHPSEHIVVFMKNNPNWHFNLCDNDCKDNFMEKVFANTSILWAYNMINPSLGTAKVEIWRLGVLYAYGGLYIDDDSTIHAPLDSVVQTTDKFIVGKEGYNVADHCYVQNYSISFSSMEERFPGYNATNILGGRFFLNWILFSAKRHPVLKRTFEHIVKLIKAEYFCKSLVKMQPTDHRGKLLMCATTYPITMASHELILEHDMDNSELGIRVVEPYFKDYQAVMKVWYSDYLPDHWVRMMNKIKVPYLRDYRDPMIDEILAGRLEGKLIQAFGDRQVYIIKNSTKRAFPDLSTFIAMGLDFSNVTYLSGDMMKRIPTGDILMHLDQHRRRRLRAK